jgi:hypothetical protein
MAAWSTSKLWKMQKLFIEVVHMKTFKIFLEAIDRTIAIEHDVDEINRRIEEALVNKEEEVKTLDNFISFQKLQGTLKEQQ